MTRWVLWSVAGITAVAAVLLIVMLWRRRRAEVGRPTTSDYVVALGIVLALFGTVVSALAASSTDAEEPSDVTAFRSEVQTACRALAVNQQSLQIATLVDANGNVDRQRLIDAFNAQIDAALGILDNLWATPVPDQLSADVSEAHQAADVLLYVERGWTNDMSSDLTDPAPLNEVLAYVQTRSIENLPNATAFESAMTHLAGEECRPLQSNTTS